VAWWSKKSTLRIPNHKDFYGINKKNIKVNLRVSPVIDLILKLHHAFGGIE